MNQNMLSALNVLGQTKPKTVIETPTVKLLGTDAWINLARNVRVDNPDKFVELLKADTTIFDRSEKDGTVRYAVLVPVKGNLVKHLGNMYGSMNPKDTVDHIQYISISASDTDDTLVI